MERKADVSSDMAINVQILNEEQMQTEIERMLNLIAGFIDNIEKSVCDNMKRLFYKSKSRHSRALNDVNQRGFNHRTDSTSD